MIAALYARVSTEDQHCEMQLHELGEYAKRMGWDTAVYLEKESTRRKRPEKVRLMADARLRKFDVVLCWKLDRFGRSVRELHEDAEALKLYGIRFVALQSAIDTDKRSPTANLLFNMLASFAEFERDLIQERTNAGIAQARRAGKQFGRPKLVFDRGKAEKMRAKGASWREIGKALKVAPSTIRLALGSAK